MESGPKALLWLKIERNRKIHDFLKKGGDSFFYPPPSPPIPLKRGFLVCLWGGGGGGGVRDQKLIGGYF